MKKRQITTKTAAYRKHAEGNVILFSSSHLGISQQPSPHLLSQDGVRSGENPVLLLSDRLHYSAAAIHLVCACSL